MKRRLLSLILAGTLVFGQCPAVLADDFDLAADEIVAEETVGENAEDIFQELDADVDNELSLDDEIDAQEADDADGIEAQEADAAAGFVGQETNDPAETVESYEEAEEEAEDAGEAEFLIEDVGEQLAEETALTADASDPIITLTADTDKPVVNKALNITVESSDSAMMPKAIRYYEDGNLSGEDRTEWDFVKNKFEGNNKYVCGWVSDLSGTHTLQVAVTYDDWQADWIEDQRHWILSNELTLAYQTNGVVGDFTFSVEKASVKRGESVKLSFTASEHADTYYAGIDKWNEETKSWDGYAKYFFNGKPGTFELETYEFDEGKYQICGFASGEGYDLNCANPDAPFELTIEKTDKTEVELTVSKSSIETGEAFDYRVFAPGASSIEVYFDYAHGKKWRDSLDSGDYLSGKNTYSFSGDFQIAARAYYGSDDKEGVLSNIETVRVTAPGGSLKFADLPAYILASAGTYQLDIKLPAGAEEMKICLENRDAENGQEIISIDRTDKDFSYQLAIGEGGVQKSLRVIAEAYAKGYDSARVDVTIPILNISADKNITLEVPDETMPVNKEFNITAFAEGADRVRIIANERYKWWNNDCGGETCKTNARGEDIPAIVYAEADYGKETYASEPVVLNFSSKGSVGEFTFIVNGVSNNTQKDPVTVTQGDELNLYYTKSNNATFYACDLQQYKGESEDGDGWKQIDGWNGTLYSDGKTAPFKASLSTLGLEEGDYRLLGFAFAEGYERTNANHDEWVYFHVNKVIYEIGKVYLRADKKVLDTCEDVTFTAYAPGAEWIEILPDAAEESWRISNDGERIEVSQSYWNSGEYKSVAIAHYADNDKGTESEQLPIKVTASKNATFTFGPVEIPAYFHEGDAFNFTVNKPENAGQLKVGVWFTAGKENAGMYLFNENTEEDSITVNLSAESLAAIKTGSRLTVSYVAGGKGYEAAYGAVESAKVAVGTEKFSYHVSNHYLRVGDKTAAFTLAPKNADEKIKEVRIWENGVFRRDSNGNILSYYPDEKTGEVKVNLWTENVSESCICAYVTFEDQNGSDSDKRIWYAAEPQTIHVVLVTEENMQTGELVKNQIRTLLAGTPEEARIKAAKDTLAGLEAGVKAYLGDTVINELEDQITAAEKKLEEAKKAAEEAERKAAEEAARKAQEAEKKAAEEAARKAAEEAAKKAEKKSNTIRVKVKNPSVKASGKKIKIAAKKVFKVTRAQGKVRYKKVSGSKALKISSSGKITVAKGTKKGTYKIKVKVTAAGNDTYKEGSKTVTVKVKVKSE